MRKGRIPSRYPAFSFFSQRTYWLALIRFWMPISGFISPCVLLRIDCSIGKAPDYYWNVEAGYRCSLRNANGGAQTTSHFVRLYAEASSSWTKTFSAKYWLEVLPSLTDATGYLINTEASVSSMLTSIFSIKTAYGIRYNDTPVAEATKKTDSAFTTALAAKF